MSEGIADELEGISLGDERLNQRSLKVIEALAADPTASINAATNGWADTQAAYRLFNNRKVSPEQILKPHREATARRIGEHAVVLLVQDTTELDYTSHPAKDALCLNKVSRLGFYQHIDLALTPDHLPLGLVAVETFDREPDTLGKQPRADLRPIEDKESFRWLKGYREACVLASQCPQTQIVMVADSEADIYDIFQAAQDQSHPRADYLIRAHENRNTPEVNREMSARTYHKVRDRVAQSSVRMQYTVDLSVTPKREARQATLVVRAISVAVRPPSARTGLSVITHQVISVEEVDGPTDDTRISWLLMTTLPVEKDEDVRKAIDYYTVRWGAEIYFRTLKTGCQVEKIQLEARSRLLNCLAFYNIIAWRILYLTYLNRTAPEISCKVIFADHEWKPVWRIVHKKPLPKQPPSLGDFMALIAHLGGYNNRPSEKPTGPLPIWIGIRRMLDYSAAWLEFGPEK
ncbi:MAG: IS4 family transposase [Planctomycetaceae bacterium]